MAVEFCRNGGPHPAKPRHPLPESALAHVDITPSLSDHALARWLVQEEHRFLEYRGAPSCQKAWVDFAHRYTSAPLEENVDLTTVRRRALNLIQELAFGRWGVQEIQQASPYILDLDRVDRDSAFRMVRKDMYDAAQAIGVEAASAAGRGIGRDVGQALIKKWWQLEKPESLYTGQQRREAKESFVHNNEEAAVLYELVYALHTSLITFSHERVFPKYPDSSIISRAIHQSLIDAMFSFNPERGRLFSGYLGDYLFEYLPGRIMREWSRDYRLIDFKAAYRQLDPAIDDIDEWLTMLAEGGDMDRELATAIDGGVDRGILSPEELQERAMTAQAIRVAMQRLCPEERLAIEGALLDYPLAELGRQAGCTREAMRQRLMRGYKKLRVALQEYAPGGYDGELESRQKKIRTLRRAMWQLFSEGPGGVTKPWDFFDVVPCDKIDIVRPFYSKNVLTGVTDRTHGALEEALRVLNREDKIEELRNLVRLLNEEVRLYRGKLASGRRTQARPRGKKISRQENNQTSDMAQPSEVQSSQMPSDDG